MSGKLVIVSGPSGVGKDTVLDRWIQSDPRVEKVVSCTTRKPRPSDVDGVDYHFMTVDGFRQKIEDGGFLEWKEVHDNLYGTPKDHVERILGQGRVAVLNIDVQGAAEVVRLRPDAVSVFLLPPSMEELERRIRLRAEDTEEQIQIRLQNARVEMAGADAYHHRIVNRNVEDCVEKLKELTN